MVKIAAEVGVEKCMPSNMYGNPMPCNDVARFLARTPLCGQHACVER